MNPFSPETPHDTHTGSTAGDAIQASYEPSPCATTDPVTTHPQPDSVPAGDNLGDDAPAEPSCEGTAAEQTPTTVSPTGRLPVVTTITQAQADAAQRRIAALRAALPMLESKLGLKRAAACAGLSTGALCKLLATAKQGPRDTAAHDELARRLLAADLAQVAPKRRGGSTSRWEILLEIPTITLKLDTLYISTMGASGQYQAGKARTAQCAITLERFAEEPECPEELAKLLRLGYQPQPFLRYLRRITPEMEARLRGEKHYSLQSASQRRDKTLRLENGERLSLMSGFIVELDDMSSNQPHWADTPEGPVISRQGLYARDVNSGRWLGCELISRPREAYRAEDILRFLRRLMQSYGKFDVLRIERGIWRSRSICGLRIDDDKLTTELITRAEWSDDERTRLSDGLESIGIKLVYVYSAHQKGGIEGGFNHLQTALATYCTDYPNLGRYAGEFEQPAKQLRRVRQGAHPSELGFAEIDQLAQRVEMAMQFQNRRLNSKGKRPDDIWTTDIAARPLPSLTPVDLAAFLPDTRPLVVRNLCITTQINNEVYDYRSEILAELGDGYRVYLKLDTSEPTLGAAIYNREPQSSPINTKGWAPDQWIGFARYEVPAPQLDITAAQARGLVGASASAREIYGVDDTDKKSIRKAQDKYVRTAFRALPRPGQPAVKAVTARDGKGAVIDAQIGGSPSAMLPDEKSGEGPVAPHETRRASAPITETIDHTTRQAEETTQEQIESQQKSIPQETETL